MKREPCNQLIFKKPLERVICDLTEIPKEITCDTGYKYILHLIDHFSKFASGYLCKQKDSDTTLNYIKEFIKNYGIRDELGTDNGKEFSNNKLKNYLSENNIKFIHGRTYNPL